MEDFELQSPQSTMFYIGHHDTERHEPVTAEVLESARSVGYDLITTPITNNHYRDHVVSTLRGNRHKRNPAQASALVTSLDPTFTSLGPSEFTPSLLAMVSPWIDITSDDPHVEAISRHVLNVEVAYAAFCGISHVVLPPLFRGRSAPTSSATARYADAVSHALKIGPYLQLLAPLPMDDQHYPSNAYDDTFLAKAVVNGDAVHPSSDVKTSKDALSPWDAWHCVRSTCNYSPKLALVLTVPRLLPDEHIQSRWYSEPLRVLHLPVSSFAPNAKSHPVLSRVHQSLLTRFDRLQQSPWLLVSGTSPLPTSSPSPSSSFDPTPAEAASLPTPSSPAPHLSYLRYLQRSQPQIPPTLRFAQGYQDYLQSPLQPLTDNLESVTYEVFEKDPIKYQWYERAIALALQDLYAELKRPITLAVVGAGRGPLMTRSLLASEATSVPIVPYAVEKNPNAYVLLQRRNATDALWANRVTVVKSDMRAWPGPSENDGKIDITISELLGSFADNELSPECLDGAQHLLHPDHGVSIPQSYTAWVTPLSTPRIHSDLLSRSDAGVGGREGEKWNLGYVSMLHQLSYLSFQDEPVLGPAGPTFEPRIEQCWEFEHPLPEGVLEQSEVRRKGGQFAGGRSGGDGWNEHNERSCEIVFPVSAKGRGVCHGLGGYFETVLYRSRAASGGAKRTKQYRGEGGDAAELDHMGDGGPGGDEGGEVVELSTNPNSMDSKSKDMISWFPIFFPLKTPLYVPDGSEMVVEMHRKTDDRKVWYTWQVSVWVEIGGIKQRTAVSEVHSSADNGCLM